ncbi:hypothetical protein Cob_v005594 [Colletotrichum orbiculare MAFF 240422]|uniref:DUF6590 domain-containing protein n=1 Tax=Colletotrichum orbiculare (strain 104-T / ATCC 96160 / CBS 514.97 / LARS 414 / MAFF 240422) TaxID=1213857 RepID=N4VPE8_COLOR|nr:hypothetical protein Cob_v005594 [Colletotrichum orbiculare MAFF 240422]
MPKPSSSSKNQRKGGGGGGGAWGEWTWSDEHKKYYCTRANSNEPSGWEYLWQVQEQSNVTTPRQADVGTLTAGMEELSTSPSNSNNYYSHESSAGASQDAYTYPYSSSGNGKSSRSKKSRDAGYGNQYGDSYPDTTDPKPREDRPEDPVLDPFYGAPAEGASASYEDSSRRSIDAVPDSTREAYYEAGVHSSSKGKSNAYSYDPSYPASEAEDPFDPRFPEALAASHDEMYGRSRRGEASDSAYVSMDPSEAGDGATTPKASKIKIDIRGTAGAREALDPRYVVEPSTRFEQGMIFKVLWPEPSGHNLKGAPTISDRMTVPDNYGGSVHVGFRRFIVVANDEGHCQCVPILTYGGKACTKKGTKPDKHGIIVGLNQSARKVKNEPSLGFDPIRANIFVEGEKLQKESRINYSKLMTVEHNVKVFTIGHIVDEDLDNLEMAVNHCWEQKSRSKRHRKH